PLQPGPPANRHLLRNQTMRADARLGVNHHAQPSVAQLRTLANLDLERQLAAMEVEDELAKNLRHQRHAQAVQLLRRSVEGEIVPAHPASPATAEGRVRSAATEEAARFVSNNSHRSPRRWARFPGTG